MSDLEEQIQILIVEFRELEHERANVAEEQEVMVRQNKLYDEKGVINTLSNIWSSGHEEKCRAYDYGTLGDDQDIFSAAETGSI